MKQILLIIIFILTLSGCESINDILDTPQNITINDNIISFNKVDNATNYVILINEQEVQTTENSYELSEYGIYYIKIKAQARGYYDSKYSDVISYSNFTLDNNLKYIYSIKSNNDLVILEAFLDNLNISINEVESKYVEYDNKAILFKNTYLKTLNIGVYEYVLTINEFDYNFKIEIIDTDKPYLIVPNNYDFKPTDDVVVMFDKFNYDNVSLNGIGISEKDYYLSDNKIIINKDFINNYFEDNPNIKLYILNLVFEKTVESRKETYLTQIFIHKN